MSKNEQMLFTLIAHQLDESLPLIYMWEIHGPGNSLLGRYIGKAKAGAKRPLKHYQRNVRNILQSRPYRKNNPQGFRRVHHALANAQREGWSITLRFLCNIAPNEDINQVEQKHIKEMNTSGPHAWQLNSM